MKVDAAVAEASEERESGPGEGCGRLGERAGLGLCEVHAPGIGPRWLDGSHRRRNIQCRRAMHQSRGWTVASASTILLQNLASRSARRSRSLRRAQRGGFAATERSAPRSHASVGAQHNANDETGVSTPV